MPSSASPSESVRYLQLLQVIDKCLSESMKAIDLDECIQQTYGDDAASYGGHDMLKQVLMTMLERVHDQVKADLSLENEKLLLERVEAIIERFECIESIQEHNDKVDQDSAMAALETTNLLTKGIEPADVLRYISFQNMKQEEEALRTKLASVEEEVQMLEEEYKKAQVSVNSDIRFVENSSDKLDHTADICEAVS